MAFCGAARPRLRQVGACSGMIVVEATTKCKPAGKEFCRQRTVHPVQRALDAAPVQRAPQLRGGQYGHPCRHQHVVPPCNRSFPLSRPDHPSVRFDMVSRSCSVQRAQCVRRLDDGGVRAGALSGQAGGPRCAVQQFSQPCASGQDGGDGAGLLRGTGGDRDRRGLERGGVPRVRLAVPAGARQDRAAGRGDPDYAGDVDGNAWWWRNFAGKHYQLENGYCEPKPDIVPPIMVGGGGERYLLRVVAEQAGD